MTPDEAAREVVKDALKADTTLFLALQHLGWIDADQLVAAFPGELTEPDPVAAILAAAPVPEPRYERVYDAREEQPVWVVTEATPVTDWMPHQERPTTRPSIHYWRNPAERPSPKRTKQARSDFAKWVENEIDYYPGVAGDGVD